jgi:predicted ester cyclase
MSKFDYEAIDRRCFEEIWTRCELGEVDAIYHADLVCHHPPDPDIIGCEGIKRQIQRTHKAYANVVYFVDDHVAQGDRTVTRWRMDGILRKPVRGSVSTELKVTITGVSIYHYLDGLIREEWTYWDQLGLQNQLKA